HRFNQAKYQCLLLRTDLGELMQAASERDRTSTEARQRKALKQLGGQLLGIEFGLTERQLPRRFIDRSNLRPLRYMHDEMGSLDDVTGSVLETAIVLFANRQHQQRFDTADNIEVRQSHQLEHIVGVAPEHPGDGSQAYCLN